MILTIAATKGGVGKSTLSIQIASSLQMLDKRVYLIDCDEQRSSYEALKIRESNDHQVLSFCHLQDASELESTVDSLSSELDFIIIDVSAKDSEQLRRALLITDILITPYTPDSFDVWGLDDVENLLKEASKIKKVKAYCLLNKACPNVKDNQEAMQAASEKECFTNFDFQVGNRKIFSLSSSQGLCVDEIKPRNKKASSELKSLIDAILKFN